VSDQLPEGLSKHDRATLRRAPTLSDRHQLIEPGTCIASPRPRAARCRIISRAQSRRAVFQQDQAVSASQFITTNSQSTNAPLLEQFPEDQSL